MKPASHSNKAVYYSRRQRGEQTVTVLTVMDLKVVDSQSFEHSHTRCMDVERLTQLCICCAVYSANLGTDRQTVGTQVGRQIETCRGANRQTGTCMWSFLRNTCSFLYSFEAALLSPNVKLINQR